MKSGPFPLNRIIECKCTRWDDACLAMLGEEKDSEEGVQLLRSFLADQKQQLDMKTAMLMRRHNSQLNFVPI